MGEMQGLGIISWNADKKSYTYYGIDNFGTADSATGTLDGKVWSWQGTTKMGDKEAKSRYTITEVAPDAQTFKWEVEDGGKWSVVMEGKSKRIGT
jgi:hypothetical protein